MTRSCALLCRGTTCAVEGLRQVMLVGRGLWEGVYRSEEDGIVFELNLYSQYILNSRVGVPDKLARN